MAVSAHRPSRYRRLWIGPLLYLTFWITTDLSIDRPHTIRFFDPPEVARLETAMWRSYYAKKPVRLFWQLAGGLRQQFRAPFWRSFVLGFQATKAAFTFKKGTSRTEYAQTLPDLIAYYQAIQAITLEQFDVRNVAKSELEWWIVHRQRDRYSYADLANALAQTSAALYSQPVAAFSEYGTLRAEAMRLCDEAGQKPGGATEADWQRIEEVLNQAWTSLQRVVGPSKKPDLLPEGQVTQLPDGHPQLLAGLVNGDTRRSSRFFEGAVVKQNVVQKFATLSIGGVFRNLTCGC